MQFVFDDFRLSPTRGREVAESLLGIHSHTHRGTGAKSAFLSFRGSPGAYFQLNPPGGAEDALAAAKQTVAALIDAERADAAKAALADKGNVQASAGWSPEDVRKVLSVLEDLKKVVPAFVG